MSKTQIGGNRIRKKSLTYEHFIDGIKFPESMLDLLYPTHNHVNKDVIDKIRYSGIKPSIDLHDFELTMLEVIGARKDGFSLGSTIESKANKDDLINISMELAKARGNYGTLDEAIKGYGVYVEGQLNKHVGNIGHQKLDEMYNDYVNAKSGSGSLTERLGNLGTGGNGSGGAITVNVLNPWRYKYVIKNDSGDDESDRTIPIPYSYVPDSNTIEVFENALLMESGVNKDYVEVDSNTIRFNYKLPIGTVVNVTGVQGGTLYLWKQTYKSTQGQLTFTFLDSYRIGTDELVVYESGILMSKDIDYEEISNNSIRFKYPLPVDVQVTVCRRR